MNQKRQYTRQQIENSIAYWTHQLHLMNETKSALIDALVDEFGHDVVFQTEFKYTLDQNGLKKIFNILNCHLFDNKLSAVQLAYWSENDIVKRMNQNEIESEGTRTFKNAPAYGVFSAVSKVIEDDKGIVIDAKFIKPVIMMNIDKLKTCIFIFAVACICHEMIHCYDALSDEHLQKYIKQCNTDEEFDPHKDIVFQQKMQEANAQGLDVVERYGSLDSYRSINNKARFKLYQFTGEDEENPDVMHHFDGHMLNVLNKKTGTGFFAMFD